MTQISTRTPLPECHDFLTTIYAHFFDKGRFSGGTNSPDLIGTSIVGLEGDLGNRHNKVIRMLAMNIDVPELSQTHL